MRTMGFKLSCGNDLETPKNMELIYKEESHVHQFIIPFKTAVWNEEDITPRRPQRNNAPNESTNQGSQQSNALTMCKTRRSHRTTAAARGRTPTLSSRTRLLYPKERRRTEAASESLNDPH